MAALCIVFNHYAVWALPIDSSHLPHFAENVFNLAYYGMTIFFVLSGFVIAYNYSSLDWRARPWRSSLEFLVYRFARLYPLLFVFIIFIIWYHPNVFDPGLLNGEGSLRGEVMRHLTMVQSSYPHRDSAGNLVIDGPFFVAWSIGTEFSLYLSFVVMMVMGCCCLGRPLSFGMLACYAAAASAILLFWSFQNGSGLFTPMPAEMYYRWLFDVSPYYRALEFCIGMAAYLLFDRRLEEDGNAAIAFLQRRGSTIGFLILLSTYVATFTGRLHPQYYETKLWAALGVLFILQASAATNLINAVLSSKPLVLVGEVSYSLYLFHFLAPNIITRHYGWDVFAWKAELVFFINLAMSIFLSLAIACGLYRLVEVPSRRYIRNAWWYMAAHVLEGPAVRRAEIQTQGGFVESERLPVTGPLAVCKGQFRIAPDAAMQEDAHLSRTGVRCATETPAAGLAGQGGIPFRRR